MTHAAYRYFALYKPAGMVSQFVSPHRVPLLGMVNFSFPEGTHAIGRLDRDSEGLLLLTTNKHITRLLFGGKPHTRTYLVQVRGKVHDAALHQLRTGVAISAVGGRLYTTLPCTVQGLQPPALLPAAATPVSPHAQTSWLQLTLTEGKYRQVRKMVAAVGHRCIRLVRTSIDDLHLDGLAPGAVRELDAALFFRLLRLDAAPATP